MTRLTQTLMVIVVVIGVLLMLMVALLGNANNEAVAAGREATAVARETQSAITQMQNSLAAIVAARAVEYYERDERVALLLAIEAYHLLPDPLDRPFPTVQAVWQVLARGTETAVALPVTAAKPANDFISPDGQWKVEQDRLSNMLKLHHRADGEDHHRLYVPMVSFAGPWQFSRDGRWFLVVNAGIVYLYDLYAEEEPQSHYPFDGEAAYPAAVTGLAISDDSRWAAVAFADCHVEVWRLGDAPRVDTAVTHLAGENTPNRCARMVLAFSPDGGMLVSGDNVGSVVIWNLRAADSGRNPVQVAGLDGGVVSILFDYGGQMLRVATQSREYAWTLDMEVLLRLACEQAREGFSEADWHDYLPEVPYDPHCPAS